MKKIISLILCIVFTFIITSPVCARTLADREIEYLANGDYIITALETENSYISPLSTTTTKSKTSKYYGKSGSLQWSIKVTGTFTYGNGSSKCTYSTVSVNIQNSNWKCTSKSASHSGNQASAKATIKQYLRNKLIQTIDKTVTLTCIPTGTFS